ncbi:hypothetical protein LTR36_006646 [Oleoguttula mirabilis]|uniref:Uncharacterized protein n=1 Tax=Oleoguttula mirabilis TaxID=1507867 RepID=A0AAV9JC88_9PEZI|nr:hypothetical protein LTR36_006646 [Oleoguttula mirabilis]
MADVAQAMGVRYVDGNAGFVKHLIYDDTGKCTGVRCADGAETFADIVLVAAGAATAGLMDMTGQLVAKGHTVGHIQLTPSEVEKTGGRTPTERLHQFAPKLADRAWFEIRIGWDADAPEFHFLISPHPKHAGLQLAAGGSARGFKFMPVIESYIADMLESKLDPVTARKWIWRLGAEEAPNPHLMPLLDLNTLPEVAKVES